MTMKPPTLPTDYDYDSAYLILKFKENQTAGDIQHKEMYVMSKRFMGNTTEIYTKVISGGTGSPGVCTFENLPDFYLTSNQASNDKFFYSDYYTSSTSADQYGYMNFEIDAEMLRSGSIYQIGIVYKLATDWPPITLIFKLPRLR
jgi:hypothetical protein